MMPTIAPSSAPLESHDGLHEQVDSLLKSNAQPLAISRMKERFLERALKDLTTNSSNLGGLEGDPSNPLLVEAEIAGQKDYFRKLKFKYLEQNAKYVFLQSISGPEPKVLQMGENEEKERVTSEKKAHVKAIKTEIESARAETLRLAKLVSEENEKLTDDLAEAESLNKAIREMELELARIRAVHPTTDRLTTTSANAILDDQIIQMQTLDDEVKHLTTQVDSTREAVSGIAKELQRLSRERDREEARAKEAKQSREKGDTNGVDELCRWYSSAIDLYKQLLGIREVRHSTNEVQIDYEEATLVMNFANGKLSDAKLLDSDIDIEEAVGAAMAGNDVPGLVGDVLTRLRA